MGATPWYREKEIDLAREEVPSEINALNALEKVWINRGWELSQAVYLIWSGKDSLEGAARIRELMEKEHERLA
jgi:hypothetical protein